VDFSNDPGQRDLAFFVLGIAARSHA